MKRNVSRQFQRGDRDANEKEILAVLRAAGEPFIILSPGDGADLLLRSNPMCFIEVKNGKDAKLTEAEKALKWDCEERGIEYHILRSAEDAAAMLAERLEKATTK